MMGLPDGPKSFVIGLVVLTPYRLWQTASHVAIAIRLYAKASSLKTLEKYWQNADALSASSEITISLSLMLVFMSPTVALSEVLFLIYAQNSFGLDFAALATSISSSLWIWLVILWILFLILLYLRKNSTSLVSMYCFQNLCLQLILARTVRHSSCIVI